MGALTGVQVGQTVITSRRHNDRLDEGTVTKVGRKWVTVGEGYGAVRYDMESGQADGKGYISPGRAWTREQWEAHVEREVVLGEWSKRGLSANGHWRSWWTDLTNDQLQRIMAIVDEAASA